MRDVYSSYPATATTLVALFMLFGAIPSVHGVVIAVGDGSGNTSAAEVDPGFANVGIRGAAGAIYLGNRWVLTASHVGGGDVDFGGQIYRYDVDSVQRLSNPQGLPDEEEKLSEVTDIVLFRLEEAPPLPALHLGCNPVDLGQEVVLIGRGRNRFPEPTFWDVTRVDGKDNDVWQEINPPPADPDEADEEGFKTNATKDIRWGANRVTLTDFPIESGFGDVMSFQTTFDKDERFTVAFEAQGVVGDSGGAVFGKNGSVWELTGLIHSVDVKDNQPGGSNGANTAVFGNETYIADLFFYADQLRSLADFEPELGDFDGDGSFTAQDIDLLAEDVLADHGVCHFDVNGDGDVTRTDVDFWLSDIVGSLAGDADLDGEVAFADLLALSESFNQTGGWAQGDFTGDTLVLFEDFLVLSANFGLTFDGNPGSPAAAATPEPASSVLLLLAFFVPLVLRRHGCGRL